MRITLGRRWIVPRTRDGEKRGPQKAMTLPATPRHPSRPLPLLPSGPGGVYGLSSRGDRQGHHKDVQNWRRERDSNPRYVISVYTLSRRAPSTTRTPLHTRTSSSPASCPAKKRKDNFSGAARQGQREETASARGRTGCFRRRQGQSLTRTSDPIAA